MYEDFVAPESLDGLTDIEKHRIKTEYDVVSTLRADGHEVRQLGVSDDVRVIRETVEGWKPQIVFNLLEEFQGEAVFDHNVVSFLELLGVPYTGCSPRGNGDYARQGAIEEARRLSSNRSSAFLRGTPRSQGAPSAADRLSADREITDRGVLPRHRQGFAGARRREARGAGALHSRPDPY